MFEVMHKILVESWSVLGDMSPFLLFGFLVAGILSVAIRPELIEKHLSGEGISPILKATLFGIPLPLCSCGVIPVAASLRKHGASKGATSAFLLSTPQTGVDSILVTYSLLGGVFAIFRPIAALFSGLFGGALVDMFNKGIDKQSIARSKEGNIKEDKKGYSDKSCNLDEKTGGFLSKIYRMFKYAFVTLPADIAGALLIGIFVAGVISAIVPDDYFAGFLGGGLSAMFVMMLLGLPVYVCATASVPVAAVLIGKGVSPGAAFAFLMTGPATNAATVAVIWKTLGKATTIIYLLTVAVLAMAGGMLLDYIFQVAHTSPGSVNIWMPGSIIKSVSAIVLLGVLVGAYFVNKNRTHKLRLDVGDKVIKLKIEGMTCSHCAESVRKGLLELDGVDDVQVDLQKSQAIIVSDNFDEDDVRAMISSLGYKVIEISESSNENE